MKKSVCFVLWFVLILAASPVLQAVEGGKSLYDFTMKDIDGKDQPLSRYKGQVVLVINTASQCGLTPQYKGLQALYQEYKDEGFVILAFPANNFGKQEPGSDEEIKAFCAKNYGVTFPLFSKISVKGENLHPLYRYLTNKETNPEYYGPIRWNFDKFLFDRNGKIITRFHPKVTPGSDELVKAVKRALAEKVAE